MDDELEFLEDYTPPDSLWEQLYDTDGIAVPGCYRKAPAPSDE